MPGFIPLFSIENPTFQMPDNSCMYPDIVLFDNSKKEATVLDVAVPYETSVSYLDEQHRCKCTKYEPLRQIIADKFKIQANDVKFRAIVVGARGSFIETLINTLDLSAKSAL